MDENLHNIDRLFKDSIEPHEENPSSKVWETLSSQLDKSNVIILQKKYNKLKRFAALLLLLLLITVIYETQFKGNPKNSISKNKVSTNENDISKSIVDSDLKDRPNSNLANIKSNKNIETTPTQKFLSKDSTDAKSKVEKIISTNSAETFANTSYPKSLLENADVNKQLKKTDSQKQPIQKGKANLTVDGINTQQIKDQSNTEPSIKNMASELILKKDTINTLAITDLATPEYFALQKINSLFINDISTNILPNKLSKNFVSSNALTGNKKMNAITKQKFSITLFYLPQFGFNHLANDDNGPNGVPGQPRQNDRDKIKNNEQEEILNSFGLNIQLNLNKHISIQSGIGLVNKNIAIQSQKIFADLDSDGKVKYRFDCSSGYTFIAPKTGTTLNVGDSTTTGEATNKLQYISIPMAINYKFNVKKFNITPSLGMAINILTKQQITTSIFQGVNSQGENITNIQGLKPSYLSALSGISFQYNFNKRLAICLAPTGSFAISSITKNAPVKSYPNAFGVAAGLKINL